MFTRPEELSKEQGKEEKEQAENPADTCSLCSSLARNREGHRPLYLIHYVLRKVDIVELGEKVN